MSFTPRERIKKFKQMLLKKMPPAQKKAFQYVKKIAKIYDIKISPERIARNYIIDIYIPAGKIGIEIDGGIHNKQYGYDDRRDDKLMEFGITIIRFANSDIETWYFKKAIWAILNKIYLDRYEFIKKKAADCNINLEETTSIGGHNVR